METLKSYVSGGWVEGTGGFADLVNPTTEETVARASTTGVDMGAALEFARTRGLPALRELSFAQRGEMIRAVSKAIYAAREELIELGIKNAGNTRGDAKFDIDGASGTLGAYADLAATLGESKFFIDGDIIHLGRSSRMAGQHVLVPRDGVAVHINAFNFPAWGLAEKAAVAWLMGLPVIAKPATATAWMTARMVERIVEANVLPPGALSLIVGGAGDLVDRLGPQDVLAFTGSSDTGAMFRAKANIIRHNVRVNIEADSLNAAILGPDLSRGDEAYDLFLADVVRDMTQKAGQKCTAIRRVFVPVERLEAVREDLLDRLSAIRVGEPGTDGVVVGPVATAAQLSDVRAGIDKLCAAPGVKVLRGGTARPKLTNIDHERGFFVDPTLLEASDSAAAAAVHEHEVFGPCATLLPYSGDAREVTNLVRLGQGGLVASLYSEDRNFVRDVVLDIAPYHGRVTVGSAKMAGASLGPGTVFPQLVHGGPGRAGGGEELGGLRGASLYLQRTALQGYGPLIESVVSTGKKL